MALLFTWKLNVDFLTEAVQIVNAVLFGNLLKLVAFYQKTRDSGVGLATGYGMANLWVRIRVPIYEFSVLCVVQAGYEAHSDSYAMGSGGCFLGGKEAGA
jgi:hypothetical protein